MNKPVVLAFTPSDDPHQADWLINCPGCGCGHGIWTTKRNHLGSIWTFNGDLVKPTFSPSLLLAGTPQCHSYITNGNIQFLSDCTHHLAGQTVPLLPP